jgi:hypothetical protein
MIRYKIFAIKMYEDYWKIITNKFKDLLGREKNLSRFSGLYMQNYLNTYATEFTDVSQDSGMPDEILMKWFQEGLDSYLQR